MVFCIVSQELGEQPIAGVEGDQAGQTTERRGARSNDINIGKQCTSGCMTSQATTILIKQALALT